MKKILYLITQSELGGAQRYILNLASGLKNQYDITVGLGEPGEKGEFTIALRQAGIKYFVLPHLQRAISPWSDFMALLEIKKLIKNIKPDIIHLNSSKISILGSLASIRVRRYTMRVFYTVHGWVFNEPLPAWLKVFYFWAEKFTARFKHKTICVSDFDLKIALARKIASAEKLITIHNGLQPINFLSRERARQTISQISNFPATQDLAKPDKFPISDIIIGTIANFYKTKGLEYLIQAGQLLQTSQPDVKIIIIGDGDERKNLEKLIKQLKLQDKIFLTGAIENAAQLLPAFNIYVSSSVKEGFPFSILEAMSTNLPIIATNVGGIPEMIKHEQNGLLIPASDSQALASAIIRLLNQPEFAKNLAAQAQKDVSQNFSLEKMVQETKAIYQNI